MTISAVPFALQNVPINADVVRQAVSSLIPDGGGLIEVGDLAVTQLGTPAMGVQVGVGRAWIDGTNLAHLSSQGYGKQGMYFVLNDAAYTVTIATSNATNPRIDVIYAATPDTAYAGATNAPVIAVATGTAVAGASYPANAPALPNNSIALAWVYVGAGVTSITNANITSLAAGLAGKGLYAAPKGLVAYQYDSTSSPGLAGTGIMCDLVQVSFVQGRRYRLAWTVTTSTVSVANMAIVVSFKKSATSDSTATGTDLHDATIYTAPVGAQGVQTTTEYHYTATATETVNIKAIMARATTTDTYTIAQRELSVTDLGMQI